MKIVVLAGGNSPERDVSLSTGKMIYSALKSKDHQVVLLDLYLGFEDDFNDIFEINKNWVSDISDVKEDNPDLNIIRSLRKDDTLSIIGPGVIKACSQADIVFLALHGENGEDGKIQALFDLMGIKYTGTDYTSSAITMDKAISKEIFAYYNIPTPKGIHIRKGDAFNWDTYPCVVKFNNGGSSVGVTIVHAEAKMNNALHNAFSFGDEAIIEQYIKGRELSVGVIDGKALPVIEIAPLSGFYDYKNKYQAGSTIETCPANIDQDISQRMQKIAVEVFKVLRLKTYARMDFMLNDNDEMFCLEANTLPGMTPTSLLPQEALAIGMDFETLCEKIIESSLRKYQ